jgi:hypothetical protein
MVRSAFSEQNRVTLTERMRDALAVGGALIAAFLYVFSPIPTTQAVMPVAVFDLYSQSLPSFLYARAALQRGWGLLWNDFQNCGQPFFGMIYSALLYPLNLPFFWVDPTHALLFQAAANLAIGGIGMYFLCRELGLGRFAALLGALAFELGGISVKLTFWSPYMIGPWAWLPMAMFLCERILRRPTAAAGVALGFCLTLQLLAGFPQIQMFTLQLIALRALWELATRRATPRRRVVLCLALGVVLPILLGAVQLLPAMEVASESIRNRALTAVEASPWPWNPAVLRNWIRSRMMGSGTLAQVATVALAAFALRHRGGRRRLLFYCGVAVLFLALSFEPLFGVYRAIPVFSSFRMPDRMLWVTGFAFAVVAAFGVDALAQSAKDARSGRLFALGLALIAVLLFYALAGAFAAWEWAIAAGVLLSAGLVLWGRVPDLDRVAIALLILANLYAVSLPPAQLYTYGAWLFRNSRAFDYVADHASHQDRMFQVWARNDFAVMARSASVYGIASIQDYEHQTSARYAAFYVQMMQGRALRALNDFIYSSPRVPHDPRLFDLVAARYVVVSGPPPKGIEFLDQPPGRPGVSRPVFRDGHARVYENANALPRAFFVPQAAVVGEPERLLQMLGSTAHDPRAVALIEERPADGFLGAPGASGTARIERSRGEELAVHVSASADGFLFVSDQLYPGWEARVNGRPVPIARANYAFRLVRVPQGDSEVVFRYRPSSVRIGAAVSLLTAAALVAWAVVRAVRRRAPQR